MAFLQIKRLRQKEEAQQAEAVKYVTNLSNRTSTRKSAGFLQSGLRRYPALPVRGSRLLQERWQSAKQPLHQLRLFARKGTYRHSPASRCTTDLTSRLRITKYGRTTAHEESLELPVHPHNAAKEEMQLEVGVSHEKDNGAHRMKRQLLVRHLHKWSKKHIRNCHALHAGTAMHMSRLVSD